MTSRDAKLVQYLNEAYGKEKELETALEAHIGMTDRSTYKKRLQQHLQETKGHARELERRIRQLGGSAESVSVPGPEVVSEAAGKMTEAARRGVALARAPIDVVRGTSDQERLLKNAKTEYWNEAEEIANYTAIETLANGVGDRKTANLARGIRRQEERMAGFLQRLIPQLTRAVVQAEIPASERNGAGRRRTTRRASRTTSRTARTSRSRSGSARTRRAPSRSSRAGRTTSRTSRTSRSQGTARTSRGRTAARPTRARSGTARASRATSARRAGTRRSSRASSSPRRTRVTA